jgi:hypothetical protein
VTDGVNCKCLSDCVCSETVPGNSSIIKGIHYDYKSTKGNKLMEKQAKRERKLAEKKAKRLAKEGPKKEEEKAPALDPNKPISLDFLTNPNKE